MDPAYEPVGLRSQIPPIKRGHHTMSCEYYVRSVRKDESIMVCSLTGRPCFVCEPDNAQGRSLQQNCTRRIFAMEVEQERTKSPESTG